MLEPIRVAVDVSAIPLEPVGAGRYALELARALGTHEEVELTLIARRHDRERLVRATNARKVLELVPAARPVRLAFEELLLTPALAIVAPKVQVMHGPHYTTARSRRVGVVTTVHDLTFVEHPEWHERTKSEYFKHALRRAAAAADAVVCVSQQTADLFVERYAPRGTIHVAPHGVDHERFRSEEPAVGRDEATLGRLCLRQPYVLHLGTIEPRKNLPFLIAAFDQLAPSSDATLVLAGRPGWGLEAVERAIAASAHPERIVRLGYVDDTDVPSLLRKAAVVAYPSLEEGFGLPALEALACGAPLVTTQASVMAELARESALVVEPHSRSALVAALESVLRGDGVSTRRELGLREAAKYTWAASANSHVLAYKDALSR